MTWALMRAVNYLAGLAWPALMFVAVFSAEIVEFLYGPAWLESAPVVPWLCLALAVKLPFTLVHQALVGIGRPYLPAVPLSASLLAKLVAVLLIFDGGLVSFGRAVAIGEMLAIPVNMFLCQNNLRIYPAEWARFIRLNLSSSAPLLVTILATQYFLRDNPNLFLKLGLTGIIASVMWVVGLKLAKHPLAAELNQLGSSFQRSK